MEHTVTDKGNYEEIALTGWGETTTFDAVHAIYGDELGVVILEPADRARRGEYVADEPVWDEDAEFRFRSDVRALVASFEDEPDSLVFDPGRDGQESEEWVKRA